MIRLTVKEFLDSHNITRYELSKRTCVHFQIIDGYYKNKIVRYDSYILNKICEALDCDISDIIEYTKD